MQDGKFPNTSSEFCMGRSNRDVFNRNVPIMGKTFLLEKYLNKVKYTNDSEVVKALVFDRFKNILKCYYERISARTNVRRKYYIAYNNQSNIDNLSTKNCASNYSALVDSMVISEAESSEETEYDAQKFLEDALGNELQKYSSQISIPYTLTSSTHSIGTEDVSILLSNSSSSSYYGLFTKKVSCKSTYTSLPNNSNFTEDSEFNDCTASVLINDAVVQQQTVAQISKLLNVCLPTEKFKSSCEYIEAERILLLATEKRKAILRVLHTIDYEDSMEDLSIQGRIQISDLRVVLKMDDYFRTINAKWFVAVFICGTSVLASSAIMATPNENICFDKSYNFENLKSSFEIVMNIYYLIQMKKKNSMFFSWHCVNRQSRRIRSNEHQQYSFILCGTKIIKIADLNTKLPFKLIQTSNILEDTFYMNISSGVNIARRFSGFLTIISETGMYATWNRRWCYLEGYILKCWNHQSEEYISNPIEEIDFSYCLSPYVAKTDYKLGSCLLIETGQLADQKQHLYIITRYYLSTDTSEHLIVLEKLLNCILFNLRYWNCMKCQLHFKN